MAKDKEPPCHGGAPETAPYKKGPPETQPSSSKELREDLEWVQIEVSVKTQTTK